MIGFFADMLMKLKGQYSWEGNNMERILLQLLVIASALWMSIGLPLGIVSIVSVLQKDGEKGEKDV